MVRGQLRRRVVWSPLLVLAVVGAQVAVISAVGVFAATPQSSSVNLSFTTSARAVVTFTPDPSPVLGSRSLVLVSDCPLPGEPVGPPTARCGGFMQIVSCADPNCVALGSFAATVFFGARLVVRVHLPLGPTTFLLSAVGYLGNGTLGVILTWWDYVGLPQGLTALSASFVLATGTGLLAMLVGWVSSRRLGEGWATEYLRSGLPRQ